MQYAKMAIEPVGANVSKSLQELLSPRDRWTQGGYAYDTDGNPVSCQSPAACRFCLLGAIYRVYPRFDDQRQIMSKLEKIAGVRSLTAWNDEPERTHDEVLDLVTRAQV